MKNGSKQTKGELNPVYPGAMIIVWAPTLLLTVRADYPKKEGGSDPSGVSVGPLSTHTNGTIPFLECTLMYNGSQ